MMTGCGLRRPSNMQLRLVTAVLVLGTCAVVCWFAHDNVIVLQEPADWQGFGPERGVYDFTVVTGLYDIGRGMWMTSYRTYNQYLRYLQQVLQLDVNLVVFIEPKGAEFVRRARKGREARTLVVESSMTDLPFYRDLPRVEEVMNSDEFQADNTNWKAGRAEGTIPLYNVVTNSKVSLVQRAIQLNPFQSQYFIWLDAGFTHGDLNIFPLDGVWHPRHLLAVKDRVTFVELRPMASFRNLTHKLHKLHTAAVAGGLFAGGTRAMLRYCSIHQQMWKDMLRQNIVDADQTTFTWAYFNDTGNFNPVRGSFFDLTKPWT